MNNGLGRLKSALSDRYTIEREIGAGGMATVYLAEDLKHHRKVAVKVLRPELGTVCCEPERFMQEIEFAAGLTHPHILPLHDSGEADGLLYYVMPYVEGESVRDRLNREKQLPLKDALQIAREVATGLNHAHKHGVVHRDIKPENILLSGGTAVLADFGIAHAVTQSGGDRLTQTGLAVGTPAYMSPEQAGADIDIDGRSDLYALGCVLYEMLAGQPPFTGPTVESVVRQHIVSDPPSVTAMRPAVPESVAFTISKTLAKAPADRFQTAEELLSQLEALVTPSGGVTPAGMIPVVNRAKRMWTIAGVPVAFAAVVAVLVVVAIIPSQSEATLDPNLVVVAVFRNETGDPSLDPLGKQVGHAITQGLLGSGVVQFTPWELTLQSSEYVQAEANAGRVLDRVTALAEETGAGTVISGAYYLDGDSIRFHVDVTDATEGKLIGSPEPVVGSRHTPTELADQLRQQVMGFLAVAFDERLATTTHLMGQLPTYEAYQSFALGMEEYTLDHRSRAALPLFYHAFELDSTFLTALIYASIQHFNLGERSRADSLLQVLAVNSDQLSEYDRNWLHHLMAAADGDDEVSLRAIRRAARVAPQSKAVFNVAARLVGLNRPQEALEVLATLDPDRGAMRGSSLYWEQVANALHMLGEHSRELEELRKARRLYPNQLALVYYEAAALSARGSVVEAREVLTRIDRVSPLHHVWVGLEMQTHGHPEAARDVYDWTVEWLRARPREEAARERQQYYLAVALYHADRWDEARQLFESLVTELPDSTDYQGYPGYFNPGPLNYLGFVGVTAARLDDRETALDISRRLAAVRLPFLQGGHTEWRARIAAVLGESEEAVRLLWEAFRQGAANPRLVHWGADYATLRDYPPFQEFLRPKG